MSIPSRNSAPPPPEGTWTRHSKTKVSIQKASCRFHFHSPQRVVTSGIGFYVSDTQRETAPAHTHTRHSLPSFKTSLPGNNPRKVTCLTPIRTGTALRNPSQRRTRMQQAGNQPPRRHISLTIDHRPESSGKKIPAINVPTATMTTVIPYILCQPSTPAHPNPDPSR